MPSQLRSDTARANGAKSRGPTTAEGKEISSRNALRHGLASRDTVLLECESPTEFEEMIAKYKDIHQPSNPHEEDLVTEMTIARWRQQRYRMAENIIIEMEMIRNEPNVDKEFDGADNASHFGEAVRKVADTSASMQLLSRYETRLSRAYNLAYRTLVDLRKRSVGPASPPASPLSGLSSPSQPDLEPPSETTQSPEAEQTQSRIDGPGSIDKPTPAPTSQTTSIAETVGSAILPASPLSGGLFPGPVSHDGSCKGKL